MKNKSKQSEVIDIWISSLNSKQLCVRMGKQELGALSAFKFVNSHTLNTHSLSFRLEISDQSFSDILTTSRHIHTEFERSSQCHSNRRKNHLQFGTSKVSLMLRYIFDFGQRELVFQNLCISWTTHTYLINFHLHSSSPFSLFSLFVLFSSLQMKKNFNSKRQTFIYLFLVEIMNWKEGEYNDVIQNGLQIFTLPDGLLGS